MIWGSRFGGLKRGRRDREGEWVWWRFGWVSQVFLGFVVVGFRGVNDGVAVLVVICVVILG